MNIKKFFAIVTLLIVCTSLLSACGSTETTTDFEEKPAEPIATVVPTQAPPTIGTFVVINSNQIFNRTTQYIMYDPETMVMWSALWSYELYGEGIGIGVSHSPMYNADGTLRLYNPTGK